jgi:hypothetical protein
MKNRLTWATIYLKWQLCRPVAALTSSLECSTRLNTVQYRSFRNRSPNCTILRPRFWHVLTDVLTTQMNSAHYWLMRSLELGKFDVAGKCIVPHDAVVLCPNEGS